MHCFINILNFKIYFRIMEFCLVRFYQKHLNFFAKIEWRLSWLLSCYWKRTQTWKHNYCYSHKCLNGSSFMFIDWLSCYTRLNANKIVVINFSTFCRLVIIAFKQLFSFLFGSTSGFYSLSFQTEQVVCTFSFASCSLDQILI